jgi:quinolinate synthase
MVRDHNALISSIAGLKRQKNAVILAHTYQPGDVQDVADFVGDSYGLSVKAAATTAELIVFCGVRFMAETAAILNPSKTVILAVPDAGCPMADMITAPDLADLKAGHPDHLVVCYVNSPADVKALSDVCVTSSNAVAIVDQLPRDKGIIFVPDKHLGSFVEKRTGRTMVLWNGFCPTHARISPAMVQRARAEHPGACVIMHPEAPEKSRACADRLLSTGQMCAFVKSDSGSEYIVATETGVIHTLAKQNPGKRFYPVSSSITCPNMHKGSLDSVLAALQGTGGLRITVPAEIAKKAEGSLRRMLELGGPAA